MIRDICWLDNVNSGNYLHGYYFERFKESEFSYLQTTVTTEIECLFGISRGDEESADLVIIQNFNGDFGNEGFELYREGRKTILSAFTLKGILYGVYELYRQIACKIYPSKKKTFIPDQSIRMINHWDNFDGSVERGYAGKSIFFDNYMVKKDLETVHEYARLLASVGINSVSINNVNVRNIDKLLENKTEVLDGLKAIGKEFRLYGIKIFFSIMFDAPVQIGKQHNFNPVSQGTFDWWNQFFKFIYDNIPDFGGIVIKADSEGNIGPSTYGEKQSEACNVIADAIAPYGGILIWRCFVYNCAQDWRDRRTDRAKAAYDVFQPFDGKFSKNVVLQIKNGPIDFQIREPVSPLLYSMRHTNRTVEFQITQEYTGQQIDLCYLVPIWKEVLDTPIDDDTNLRISNAIKKNSCYEKYTGFSGVANIGSDYNWTGSKLAQANLYGFGRLSWNNTLTAEEIADEWIRQTFNLTHDGRQRLLNVLMTSRDTFEMYTCPLGVGFMCTPEVHYGVNVDGYEYDKWGTYHHADRNGVGRDRTRETGTDFVDQYPSKTADEYNCLKTCPDNLLLFFHHVPYEHVLLSGKTVIQHIYDTHFEGVEHVESYIKIIEGLRNQLSEEDYQNIHDRLLKQIINARQWRDVVNTYFYRKSGIPDKDNRKVDY